MGDRVVVIFTDGSNVSPVCYLHWGGDSAPALIEKLKALMAERTGDVEYAAARFVSLACADTPDSNRGIGIWNTPENIQSAVRKLLEPSEDFTAEDRTLLKEYTPGDAGVVIVEVKNFTWRAFGGYLDKARQDTNA